MELRLKDTNGKDKGGIEVRKDVFDVPANPALVHQVMVGQRANLRQGTAGTKTRTQVSGGGRKPWPQKHTGRARAGSIRAPQWKGGGVAFGPTPRSYRQRTPKRMRRSAMLSVLSDKVRERVLVVLEAVELEENTTKSVAGMLNALKTGPSVLLVADGASPEALRATRNIPRLKMIPANLLNALDLLNHHSVVMTQEAVRKVEELWGAGASEPRKEEEAVEASA